MRRATILLLCLVWTLPAWAERITVSVASNFLTTARDLSAAYEAATGHRVDLVHGSTGKLFAQIRAGAPFDVFLSADAARPERLVATGMAQAENVRAYAIGRLALIHRDGFEPGDLDAILSRPSVRFAIADPAVAPYGAAAREVLRQRLGNAWRANVVLGESVGQAFAFVATGNADAGLVALAQVRTFDGGIWSMELPDSMHAPIRQDAVLLERAAANEAAQSFFAFLTSPLAQQIIADAGYEVPE